MPTTYQAISTDEKSSLLGAEFARQHPELVKTPLIVEHYTYDVERGYRKRRQGCCTRLCWFLVWMVIGVFGILFILRHGSHRFQLPNFWSVGSPVDVPVAVTQCPSAPISYKPGELKFSFDVDVKSNPNRFYFGQQWNRKTGAGSSAPFIQTAGNVIVQAAPAGSEPVTVDLDVKLSHDELAQAINIKQEAAGLLFESATFLKDFTGEQPCISVVATISVAPSTNVTSFDIDTVVLPVELKKNLQLAAGNLYVHSTAGSISSKASDLDARRIEVETTSNTISGSFPLADLLSLKTVSGDVNVDIEPKDAVVPEEQPATLLIRTSSGNIQANTATSDLPNRNFTTQVHTVSGSVSGSYPLGIVATMTSANGAVSADLYTVGDAAKRTLTVNSVSGTVKAVVHDDAYPLGVLKSNLHSQTGGVDARLPAAFEGRIQAETKMGSVDIVGDGVKIIKDVSPFPGYGRIVVAEKGVGESSLSVQTLNSAISVNFA